MAAVIVQDIDPRMRPELDAAQVAGTLSPDAHLVHAALAEKIDR